MAGKNSQPRVVAFGKFAGMAGMIDGFQGLGLKLLAEGIVQNQIHSLSQTHTHSQSLFNKHTNTSHTLFFTALKLLLSLHLTHFLDQTY